MKIIYVDNEYKCHLISDGTMKEIQQTFFNDKCDTFIEGYCYDDSRGYVQVYPWKPYEELIAAQHEYEQQKLSIYEESLLELGVEVNL